MFKFKKSCFGYFYSVKSIFFAFFLTRNIWNQILHNLSDLELKKNTTRENLNWIFCIASDFDMKFNNAIDLGMENFRDVRLQKKFCIQKITFWSFLLRENDILCIFCFLIEKHDFEIIILQRVRFWIEKKTKPQNLN